jgi:hypothetical protein
LPKMELTCFLDCRREQVQRLLDAGVGLALCHLAKHVEFAGRERSKWRPRGTGTPRDQPLDDNGVDDRSALGDFAQGPDEVLDVAEPVLEQVGQPGGAVMEKG